MNLITPFVAIVALAVSVAPQGVSRLTFHDFTTQVDHFRPQDGRLVNFTYALNDEFYETNGPIYIFVNDGGLIQHEYLESGLIYDLARSTQGALATARHRYTGTNLPTEDASFENLQYLTVEQALGDLAALIATLRRDLNNSEGRVIVWGTGYGATLATFARKKFPHLVDAVFASSPLFRAEAIDTSYYDNLSSILRQRGGTDCADRVHAAFFVLQILLDANETEYLEERFRLCTPISADNDQETAALTYRLVNTISEYIRRNNLPGVESFCRDMSAISADPFNSLLRWIEYAYGANANCVTTYDQIIDSLNKTSWNDYTAQTGVNRAQAYLQCTQLGGLKVTTDSDLGLFPVGLITEEYQYRFCEDVFGEGYNRRALEGAVVALNLNFGGQDQIISNVAFSNAALDPLIHHGIADYAIYQSVVVLLEDYSAGSDLKSISGLDSDSLATAKRAIEAYVRWWATGDYISRYSYDHNHV